MLPHGEATEAEVSVDLLEFISASGILTGAGGEMTFTVPAQILAETDQLHLRVRVRRLPQP